MGDVLSNFMVRVVVDLRIQLVFQGRAHFAHSASGTMGWRHAPIKAMLNQFWASLDALIH